MCIRDSINNKSTGIDLALKINPEPSNPLSIELKGHDISKDLITFLLPKSLNEASSYIDTSMNLGIKNSIFFNYSIPGIGLNSDFKAKILINELELVLNEDSKIDLTSPMIEVDSKNLYIFSPSGKAANFSYDEAYGLSLIHI